MNSAVIVLIALGVATLCAVLLVVYGLRVLLRIVALRNAVAFLQADGTGGHPIDHAAYMFAYLTTGRRPR